MRKLRTTTTLIQGAVALLVVFVMGGGTAVAAETHAFDATLSLTGNCKTSATDPVPDPAEPPCPAEPAGAHPPSGAFNSPRSVTTDEYGNIYVASYGQEVGAANAGAGRIDVFDSAGFFITEILDPDGPKSVAVDSSGNLYVFDFSPATSTSERIAKIVRYKPTTYNPAAGEISYGNAPTTVTETGLSAETGIAINRANQHLFVHNSTHITEYGSAAEGNPILDETIGEGVLFNAHGLGLAVDAAHKRIYASDSKKIRVFELEPPHKLLLTIEGSDTPPNVPFVNQLSVAADEGTGHFFIYDGAEGADVVYEFTEAGEYVSTIEHNFQPVFGAEIAVDNGKNSPNGALNPDGRYLYVPSHPSGVGHSFAFAPLSQNCPPEVESTSFSGVTDDEAVLEASIEPCHLPTEYTFEYTTEESFEAEGFAGAQVAGKGLIPAGGNPVPVSVAAEGLEPGTAYRFRVVATNEEGSDEGEGTFSTYLVEAPEDLSCPNRLLRSGPSALLPDCRAYELVTPADTNGRAPLGVGHLGTYFATLQASPQGGAVNFEIEGGAIPGFEATGSFAGDPYLAKRTATGWSTEYTGPTGEESPAVLPGSNSPDQGYSFWSTAKDEGTAAVGGTLTRYVRYPDGHSALIGRGSLGTDPHAKGLLISENGGHIIFQTTNFFGPAIPLEENAPAEGTETLYDRTPDEVTHVVSLLPNDETPPDGENAFYQGASLDGKGVAFKFGPVTIPTSALYLRYNNEETYEIAPAGATFAGVAEGGKRIFYLEGGNLFAYEVGGGNNPIAFSTTGDVTPVNISADGSTAYFVSPSVLGEENPNEESGQLGQENLYRSEEGSISFVGTVTERDVEGESNGNEVVDGLGLWTVAVGPGQLGKDPSRTTPDGKVLLFSSRAALDGYNPEGHPEIYRYDFAGGELDCLSCNPTGAAATGSSSLQSVSAEQGAPEPFSAFAFVENLRPDGDRAFFQSTEPLVLDDTDGLQDVYEWEADGVGSCAEEGGCLALISSGRSDRIDYLFAVSESGDDAFFISSDLLVPADIDETPSIYDARVGGGFAEERAEICHLNESCPDGTQVPPALPTPASSATGPSGNPEQKGRKHCPKGKRLVKRHGKEVCVKKKKHRKHHRKASAKRKGSSR